MLASGLTGEQMVRREFQEVFPGKVKDVSLAVDSGVRWQSRDGDSPGRVTVLVGWYSQGTVALLAKPAGSKDLAT